MHSKIRKECDFQDFWPQCASTYVIWNWLFDKTFVFDVSFPFLIADAWNLYKKLPRTESIKIMICYIFIQMWQKCFFHTKMCNHHWCFPHKLVISIRKTSVLIRFDCENCCGPSMTFFKLYYFELAVKKIAKFYSFFLVVEFLQEIFTHLWQMIALYLSHLLSWCS